jgi:hypothetical protein
MVITAIFHLAFGSLKKGNIPPWKIGGMLFR